MAYLGQKISVFGHFLHFKLKFTVRFATKREAVIDKKLKFTRFGNIEIGLKCDLSQSSKFDLSKNLNGRTVHAPSTVAKSN